MSEARIDGKAASLEAAATRAAEILTGARLPVFAGLGTDIAGARVSISLAERLHGAYDHIQSKRIFADLDVWRQAGMMFTTSNEARLRADVIVFIGKGLTTIWPQLLKRLAPGEIPALDLMKETRKLLWIAPSPGEADVSGLSIKTLEAPDLRVTLAALRARLASKPITSCDAVRQEFDEIAKMLKGARFGVVVFGGDDLDSLAIEMINGIIADLNVSTRFSTLPLGADANAAGVLQASGWMTGLPMRTCFGRSYPEHDTWRFEATRLVESGEADAAVWISAYSQAVPAWNRQVPLIALVPPQTQFAQEPQVLIEVGCPGVDHDGADFEREVGAIVARQASHPSDAPTVAAVITRIAQQIGGDALC
jgi:formylmethanofuran dehydrogenase subunit B